MRLQKGEVEEVEVRARGFVMGVGGAWGRQIVEVEGMFQRDGLRPGRTVVSDGGLIG